MKKWKLSIPSYRNQVEALKRVGYTELARKGDVEFQKFEEYMKRLVKILVKAERYFMYVKQTFEAIIEMKEIQFSS